VKKWVSQSNIDIFKDAAETAKGNNNLVMYEVGADSKLQQ